MLSTSAALGTAVSAGVYFAFSTFVMRGLDRTGPASAITAMHGMNVEARGSGPFLVVLVGSTLLCAAVGVVALSGLRSPGSGWLLAGAILGVVGLVVTGAISEPLNLRLDAIDPAQLSDALGERSDGPGVDAAQAWRDYLSAWTVWNHVRTIAGVIGAVLLLIGASRR